MSAARYDLTIEQGAFYGRLLTLKKADGSAFDYGAYVGSGQIRASAGAPRVLGTFTIAPVGASANGQFRMSLTAAETAALPVTGGKYDIFLAGVGLPTRKLMQGMVTVVPRITRPE